MAQRENFFARLTKLFRSGPSIRKRVKGQNYQSAYDRALAYPNQGFRGPASFGRESSAFSTLGTYGIMDRVSRYAEFCFAPETLVYTTSGVYTIAELAEKYPNGERFQVYSYDHKKKSIVVADAHHPRITKDGVAQKVVQITFDDGGSIKTTLDHKVLLRSGEYIEAQTVDPGMSLMPFYVKDISDTGYKHIYTIGKTDQNRYGWTPEHRLVAENILGRSLTKDEVVHHMDFNPQNNHPSNLKVVSVLDHKHFHAQINNRNKFNKPNIKHSDWMRKNNPVLRQDITFEKIFDIANQVDFSLKKTMDWLDVDQNVIKRRLRKVGFKDWKEFADSKGTLSTIRNASIILTEMAPPTFEKMLSVKHCANIYEASSTIGCTDNAIRRFLKRHNLGTWSEFKGKKFTPGKMSLDSELDSTVAYQNICNTYTPGMTTEGLAGALGTTINKVKTRLEREGWASFYDWSQNFKNHKVAKVEFLPETSVVYNLTVDGHHNLAVGSLLSNPVRSKSNRTTRTYSMVICRQSEMEYTPEIGTALNIYADESCSSDEKGKSFHVYSENPEIKKQLEELFYDTLNIEFNLRPWIRNLVKYGDFFLYNEVIPDIGVVNCSPMPVNEIERDETGFDKEDPYAIRFKWLNRNKILENWQVTHFRIQGNDLFLPYGTSVLESARRIWRQLTMIEDAMLVYRIVRSPERRVFYIDVGNTAPNDIPSYMEKAKSTLRSNTINDANSGRQDLRYNPVAVDEDYFIAVRGAEGGTKIETLAGGQHVSATEDVEYIQKKLFSALSIPRAYLGYDESISSKATLAQEDIRFSRTITIIQKIIIAELNKLAMLHLYAKGFDGEDLIDFELFLSNPSSVALQQKLALWSDRIDIATKFKESVLVSEEWIQAEILGFNLEEINKMKTDRKQDVLYQKELESIAVSAENQERQATVDPFDQSQYNVPGASVAKNPSGIQGSSGGKVTDNELLANIAQFDTNGGVMRAETAPGTSPIAATPYATQRRRNEKRRVGMGGDFNLQNPDFSRMLDMGGANQYNVDVYDDEFLGKRGKNEAVSMEKVLRRAPELSSEMKRMFERMDKKFGVTRNKVISETFEERLDKEMAVLDPNDFSGILEASPVSTRMSENIEFELTEEVSEDENTKKSEEESLF